MASLSKYTGIRVREGAKNILEECCPIELCVKMEDTEVSSLSNGVVLLTSRT